MNSDGRQEKNNNMCADKVLAVGGQYKNGKMNDEWEEGKVDGEGKYDRWPTKTGLNNAIHCLSNSQQQKKPTMREWGIPKGWRKRAKAMSNCMEALN